MKSKCKENSNIYRKKEFSLSFLMKKNSIVKKIYLWINISSWRKIFIQNQVWKKKFFSEIDSRRTLLIIDRNYFLSQNNLKNFFFKLILREILKKNIHLKKTAFVRSFHIQYFEIQNSPPFFSHKNNIHLTQIRCAKLIKIYIYFFYI